MDPQFLVLGTGALVFAGVTGGLLAGMLGVGGGIIIVPIFYTVLTALGIEPALAIKVAHPLTHKSGMIDIARSAYDRALDAALTANAIQRGGRFYTASWGSQRGDNRIAR